MAWASTIITATIILVVYLLFQLKLLPRAFSRLAGRFFFYPTMPFTYLSRKNNYWTLIDSHVFLGAAPIVLFLDHVNSLYVRGVRGVINLCDENTGPTVSYRKVGMEQLYLPTLDHTEPSMDDIHRSIAFIEKHKKQGSRVYIHCKAGRGRSAAIAFCWLLHAHRDWDLISTQEYLDSKRNVRPSLYRQPNIISFYQSISQS